MILVDTGPLVALFDPKDREHRRSVETLRHIREPLLTTVAVLTETFHMLRPDTLARTGCVILSSTAVFRSGFRQTVADPRV